MQKLNISDYARCTKEVEMLTTFTGTIIKGFMIASGKAPDCKYEGGTILMQKPFFESAGIDMSDKFPGTINLDISPHHIGDIDFDIHVQDIPWNNTYRESFSFKECSVQFYKKQYDGYIYKPHKDAEEIEKFHKKSTIELLLPNIAGIEYGLSLEVAL